jgi:hypothetical protein
MPVGGNNLWSPFHLGDCDWFTGKSEVMPGTDSQRRWPEVLVLYLKRPPSEELGVETLRRGASDTAT